MYWYLGLIISLLMVVGFWIYDRRRHLSPKQKLELEREYATRNLRLLEYNRKKLAAELHDDIAQQLVLSIQSMPKGPEGRHANHLIREALKKLRNLSRGQFPYHLEHVGLAKSLEELIDRVEENSEIVISESLTENIHLPVELSLHVYRMIQEFTNNTLKYSGASSVFIGVQEMDGVVTIEYNDNGLSFDFYKKIIKEDSMGLKETLDRMRLLKAEIISLPSVKGGNQYKFKVHVKSYDL